MKPEKQLYQWDVNQYLAGINPAAQYVDYTIGNEVIRLETDGTRCRIPDEVLQTDDEKTCYERYQDGTFRAYSFTVLYAPKPPDYVYTPEERTTFEALTARVDASVDEIKRRADSGEFTPKKGVDYFTNAEKAEMMESVSDGAIGEFRNVVDTATTEYNDNASEKLTTYDTNAEQHTTDYNRNAEQKLEAYNSNHTEKVAEYNQNAETKTAEFDANAAALQEQMSEKANVDGYYEEMTVGDAEQLISTQFMEDNEPYLFRPTGGSSDVGNRAYLDKIVGGTVAWNQLVANGYATERSKVLNRNYEGIVVYSVHNKIANHKYLIRCKAKVDVETSLLFQLTLTDSKTETKTSGNFNLTTEYAIVSAILTAQYNYSTFSSAIRTNDNYDESVTLYAKEYQVFDLTQMFGPTIADYIYSLEQSQAGAGVAWFKKLFPKDYYPYNAGELLSVEGLQSHDTVGFNAFDIATNKAKLLGGYQYEIVGAYTSMSYEDVSGNAETLTITNKLFTPTNNGILTVVGADSTTCVHLVWLGYRNGEYEPYEKHSYPLDSSLTLRGIPKLDASNNLYYDGDEYTSDGKVKRTYGVVDLGTLEWRISTNFTNKLFYANLTGLKVGTLGTPSNVLTKGYVSQNSNYVANFANVQDKSVMQSYEISRVYITDNAYTDAKAFKAAMSGVMLVYELATPTTETAEPFQNIQVADDFGTEEFVSTGIVPVGHKTRYPANLRDKLQHLPSLASADGTYLIQQSGKQMSLIHMPAVFPDTPTEDGTYMLKTVVTGGVATIQWVAE